jgi:hypothetical protein
MSIASRFENLLSAALDDLTRDEWALTRVREQACANMSAVEAFASVSPVLGLAARQSDAYVYVNCVWLAVALAQRSDTTEEPPGLEQTLQDSLLTGKRLGVEGELVPLLNWYRRIS